MNNATKRLKNCEFNFLAFLKNPLRARTEYRYVKILAWSLRDLELYFTGNYQNLRDLRKMLSFSKVSPYSLGLDLYY